MIKIFSKLKLIITTTVILITLLFGILIYRQYHRCEADAEVLNESAVTALNRDIHIILNFYSELAGTYYFASFDGNPMLINALNEAKVKEANGDMMITDKIASVITPVYGHASRQMFSYIKVYNHLDTELLSLPSVQDALNVCYTFRFPVVDHGEVIGHIELGLPINSIIETLASTTSQTTYGLIRKTPQSDAISDGYTKGYFTSKLSDSHYVDLTVMEKFYAYTNSYDRKAYQEMIPSVTKTATERLVSGEDFIISHSMTGKHYSLIFTAFDTDEPTRGYIVLFKENPVLTDIKDNLRTSIVLLVGLYLTLMFVVSFIYYILQYLYHFTYTDHLTKTYNRHKFFELIKNNIYEFHRYNYMFSIILMDIDNFKSINDSYGHNKGDDVLIAFADVIQNSLRTTDHLFRWGGEEFLVLLSHCDAKVGYQVAEKLRTNIESHNFMLKNGMRVTASFGVAGYRDDSNLEMIISQADKALYHSKNTGKNRSSMYRKDFD